MAFRPTNLLRAFGRPNEKHKLRPKLVNLQVHTVMGRAHHPLPPAFELVRRCLAERGHGLTTHELVDAGMKLAPPRELSEDEIDDIESKSKKLSEKRAAEEAKVKRGKEDRPMFTVSSVPSTHPFVSTTFLKRRVLTILESQGLVEKKIREPRTTPPVWEWRLVSRNDTTESSGNAAASSSKTTTTATATSLDEHWQRLINGEGPQFLYADLKREKASKLAAVQEERFARGQDRRTHEQIRAWDDRAPGITTERERDHLNKRRGLARPAKERQRYGSVADVGLRSSSAPAGLLGGSARSAGVFGAGRSSGGGFGLRRDAVAQ